MSTRNAYGADVRAFARAVGDAGVRGATLESVSWYVAGLGREAKATRACSALKSWYTWLTERNVIRKNPTARLKFKEAWALRDLQPALSSLLLDEGLTAPQIAALRWSDVVRPLADVPRKARVRVGKRTRSISTDTHRRLLAAFDEGVRREGIVAFLERAVAE